MSGCHQSSIAEWWFNGTSNSSYREYINKVVPKLPPFPPLIIFQRLASLPHTAFTSLVAGHAELYSVWKRDKTYVPGYLVYPGSGNAFPRDPPAC